MGLIQPAAFQGDRAPGSIVRFKFAVNDATGAMASLGGTPALSVYRDGYTTESVSGVTLTVDFDSRTGMCDVAIDTSSDAGFYAGGSDYEVVITTGTVGAVNVAGSPVGHFSLSKCTATLADGVTHGGTPGSSTATFAMQKMTLQNDSDNALEIITTTSGNGIHIDAAQIAMRVYGDTAGFSVFSDGTAGQFFSVNGVGLEIDSSHAQAINVSGGDSAVNPAILITGNAAGSDAIKVIANGAHTIHLLPVGGYGLFVDQQYNSGNWDGVNIAGIGTGHDINLVGDGKLWDNINGVPVGISLDLTQMIPTSNTDQSLGDCLNATRAQGFGKWRIDAEGLTLTLYAPDGTTPVHVFTIDSATAPSQRV